MIVAAAITLVVIVALIIISAIDGNDPLPPF